MFITEFWGLDKHQKKKKRENEKKTWIDIALLVAYKISGKIPCRMCSVFGVKHLKEWYLLRKIL